MPSNILKLQSNQGIFMRVGAWTDKPKLQTLFNYVGKSQKVFQFEGFFFKSCYIIIFILLLLLNLHRVFFFFFPNAK